MTKPNLWKASMLDASGELNKKAKAQLLAYLARHPESQAAHDAIHHDFEQLRMLPPVKMTEFESQSLVGRIKESIHKKLNELQAPQRTGNRWKMIYHTFAGAAAMAACVIIALSVYYAHTRAEMNRAAAVAKAEGQMRDFLDTGSQNLTDYVYDDVATEIQTISDKQHQLIAGDLVRNAMLTLAEDATDVTELEAD